MKRYNSNFKNRSVVDFDFDSDKSDAIYSPFRVDEDKL